MLSLKFIFTAAAAIGVLEISCAFMETSLRHYETLVPGTTKHVNFDKLRVRKINKTHHAFLGELEVFQSFGNKYKISGLMYKMAGNDYKLLPYKLGPDGWCDFLTKNPQIYAEFTPVSDFPPIEECPWEKGVYTLYAYLVGPQGVPPFLGFGDYKFQLLVHLNEELVNGFNLFVNIMTLGN